MTQPNVDFAQLRAMVFCREVRRADSGVTLIDLHDRRFSPGFPVQYDGDDLFIYVSFEALRRERVQAQLFVMRPGSNVPESFADTIVEPDESLVVIAPVPMKGFVFDRPGTFNFALYVDGRLIGSARLTIETAPVHVSQLHDRVN